MEPPKLWRIIDLPETFQATMEVGHRTVSYGGDIRLGDLRNTGQVDFLVYRSVDNAHDEGGMKPCFMAAFTMDGEPIWKIGQGGTQPSRPGPVAVHDIDGDGRVEVVCFFINEQVAAPPGSLANLVIQIRDGETGCLKREASPAQFRKLSGHGPNWVHQRILIANLRGLPGARDFIVKLGAQVLAFDSSLELLWQYETPWTEYGHCPAYIPAVGDIDGDGRDEVNGGYFLLDHDGRPWWQKDLAPHMDSVAIEPWEGGCMRAICSGHGQVLDQYGNLMMKLGPERVPHGQEVRVGRFRDGDHKPQMVIRCNGHSPQVVVVDVDGVTLSELELNPSPNNTGMEVVYWDGEDASALLYNGGMLWNPLRGIGMPFPELPPPEPIGRMAWYHCIPANLCGDQREEVVLYNPWTTRIYVYTQQDSDGIAATNYRAGPRQYNPRLMD